MLKLRPYKRCDAATVISWAQDEQCFYNWTAGMLGEYPPTVENMYSFYESIADNAGFFQIVAYDEAGIAGYMTMRFPEEDSQVMRFGFIIVDPARRGQGYGKQMIRLVKQMAFDYMDVKKITLGVFEDNDAAIHCYRAAGFWEIHRDEKESYEILGQTRVCKEMEAYAKTDESYVKATDYPEEKMIGEIIANNSFRYAFQPIVEVATGNVFGYEALMRAEYNGPVPPTVVLDAAGKYGRLEDIERATFTNVLQHVAGQRENFVGKKVFVNSIPGHLLSTGEFAELVTPYKEMLPDFVVEITEGAEISDSEWSRVRKAGERFGFDIAIDDYGTGYSNTGNLLKHIPGYVKIDHLLITNIQDDDKKRHFVKSIVEFAHNNGFKALAEGVENIAELKAVIQLGVDLIQGFYTARPSFEVIQEIPAEIRQQILHATVRSQTLETRKVFKVQNEREMPLMRIALEQYTGILVDVPEFTLVGNLEYTAAMAIKVQDNCTCRLVLNNVLMESFQDLPCIELGKNSHVTLVLKGKVSFAKSGICVPEGSSLRIEGGGNLFVRSQGVQACCIGNTWESAVGDITLASKGLIRLIVEADYGICLGGGVYRGSKGLEIVSGEIDLEPASANVIGIGCAKGNMPVKILGGSVSMDLRMDTGIGVGCLEGEQDILLENTKFEAKASGGFISVLGTYKKAGGQIIIRDSKVEAGANGQEIYVIGSAGGELSILAEKSEMNVKSEGSSVMALGARENRSGRVEIKDSDVEIIVRSGNHMLFGASGDNMVLNGGRHIFNANA